MIYKVSKPRENQRERKSIARYVRGAGIFQKVVWLKTETSKGKCGVFQSPADYGILGALPSGVWGAVQLKSELVRC